MMLDSLTNAIHVTSRCQDACEGTDEVFLFGKIRDAISELRDGHPDIIELTRRTSERLKKS